ncbi:MAG: restriction endonuclease subunit S [Clostridia bacterium]
MSREMKDSGVEWIGEIPEDWEIIRAKNVFSYHKDIVGEKENEYERLSLTLNGVLKRKRNDSKGLQSESLSTYQILNKDELVFKMIDLENISTSRVGYSKYTGLVSPVYIIFNNSDYARFGYYYFYNMWQRAIFNQLGNNGVRSALNASDMLNLPFPKISKKEANKIANFLDEKVGEIDRLIDNAKKGIEEYKKYKQSVITKAVTKGLDSNVEMKDSGVEWIGEIPKDWEFRKIKSFSDIISKGTTPKEMSTIKDSKYTIRYIKSENIVDDKLIDKPEFYITNDVNEELKRSQLTDKDILFVIAGASIGKVAIMEGDLLPANTNQAISFIRIKDEYLIYKKYLWYFLQSNIIKVVINLYSVQSAQPNLSMENLGNIKIPFPFYKNDINEIIEYLDNKCYEIENLIFKKEKLISELESYKKSLIYEYVTGKKEV